MYPSIFEASGLLNFGVRRNPLVFETSGLLNFGVGGTP